MLDFLLGWGCDFVGEERERRGGGKGGIKRKGKEKAGLDWIGYWE